MRFNWNGAVATVGLMADQPEVKSPITGKGYTVKRNPKKGKKQQFVIVLTEGDYAEPEGDSEDGE